MDEQERHFKHTCTACIFLGCTRLDRVFDLYFCEHHVGNNAVVLIRYNYHHTGYLVAELSAVRSSIQRGSTGIEEPVFAEALHRAEERGLVK